MDPSLTADAEPVVSQEVRANSTPSVLVYRRGCWVFVEDVARLCTKLYSPGWPLWYLMYLVPFRRLGYV